MFAATVITLSLILLGLCALWVASSGFRTWIEAPKYALLDREQSFEAWQLKGAGKSKSAMGGSKPLPHADLGNPEK